LEGFLTLRSPFFPDLADQCLNAGRIYMARKLGFNHPRMHSGSTHAAPTMTPVKRDGEKNVRDLANDTIHDDTDFPHDSILPFQI
jgi:hypothetical protein